MAAARILVVGAGGLGCPGIQYLALSGVGVLGIVDDDAVELSNLQRQVLFRPDQLGVPKARAAADWVRAANSDVTVRVHPIRLDASTASILDDYDLVVDGSDSFDTCYLVADAAAARGIPVVWGSVNRFDGQVGVFWDAAPDGRGVDYRDLHPEPPASGWDESCADVGVLGPLCGTVGSVMASEAIKLVTGVGDSLLGRIVTIDAAGGSWRESRLVRSAARREARAAEVSRLQVAAAGVAASVAATGAATGGAVAERQGGLSAVEALADAPTLTADALEARLDDPADDFVLLDVREETEYLGGALPGALPAFGFGSTSPEHPALDPSVPVVLYCARGPRSQAAARLLHAEGFDVTVLARGMLGWTLRESALAAGGAAVGGAAAGNAAVGRASAAGLATDGGRVPLPLGDIDPANFRPNRHS